MKRAAEMTLSWSALVPLAVVLENFQSCPTVAVVGDTYCILLSFFINQLFFLLSDFGKEK